MRSWWSDQSSPGLTKHPFEEQHSLCMAPGQFSVEYQRNEVGIMPINRAGGWCWAPRAWCRCWWWWRWRRWWRCPCSWWLCSARVWQSAHYAWWQASAALTGPAFWPSAVLELCPVSWCWAVDQRGPRRDPHTMWTMRPTSASDQARCEPGDTIPASRCGCVPQLSVLYEEEDPGPRAGGWAKKIPLLGPFWCVRNTHSTTVRRRWVVWELEIFPHDRIW